jgi:hypothetical protein
MFLRPHAIACLDQDGGCFYCWTLYIPCYCVLLALCYLVDVWRNVIRSGTAQLETCLLRFLIPCGYFLHILVDRPLVSFTLKLKIMAFCFVIIPTELSQLLDVLL